MDIIRLSIHLLEQEQEKEEGEQEAQEEEQEMQQEDQEQEKEEGGRYMRIVTGLNLDKLVDELDHRMAAKL